VSKPKITADHRREHRGDDPTRQADVTTTSGIENVS
jgi:hypothetical protein